MMVRRPARTDNLCYLSARAIDGPAGRLAGVDLCGPHDEKLGRLDGVLIDPASRRLRYFVVASHGWLGKKRYLLSADEPAHLEHNDSILRIEVDTREQWRQTFDADSVRAL